MSAEFLDLRSDTFSVPCRGMRQAIANAQVGDDVFSEDPTVNSLEERTAELLGKEAGLFVASGTMGNGIGIRVLTSPGDQVICGSKSHIYNYEGGQFSLNSGLQLHRLDEGADGMPCLSEIQNALSLKEDIHRAPRTLLSLENTHNLMGGRIPEQSKMVEACRMAKNAGLATYLDGARLWHAHVERNVSLAELAAPFDMVSVCFSKALGAPVGSLLAGSRDQIDRARWFRKRMGGAMRQTGIIAAGCHYALDNNLPRLGRTREYAVRLAEALAGTGRFSADTGDIHSNIVFLKTEEGMAERAVSDFLELGIKVLALDSSSVRMVTHLSIDPKLVDRSIERIEKEWR
ncbi:low specificity L-threonine aldolase [Candidatus Fermentibacteria bacterium]|nr:MAG: low specificity L-threonine aldolase [Candidatus Fermentibacteria bacterium]